jgi:transposase
LQYDARPGASTSLGRRRLQRIVYGKEKRLGLCRITNVAGEYHYEGAMLRYLQSWIDQLRWQRLKPFEKLAGMLLDHLEGILNYSRARIAMGAVEAINGNIKALLRRGRGYKNLHYLLLKAQRMAATRTEFVSIRKTA